MMNNEWSGDQGLFGRYTTKTFSEVFIDPEGIKDSSTVFIEEYTDNGVINDESLKVLFRLLYARYGNNPIANMDENQFKAKIYSNIYMYGGTWEKRVEIQKLIRELTEEQIMAGTSTVYNHAYNPGTETTEEDLKQLKNINDQNTTNYTRSKLDGYERYLELLKTDVTKSFIDRFAPLFTVVVKPNKPLYYEGE